MSDEKERTQPPRNEGSPRMPGDLVADIHGKVGTVRRRWLDHEADIYMVRVEYPNGGERTAPEYCFHFNCASSVTFRDDEHRTVNCELPAGHNGHHRGGDAEWT